jgi:hypothetical protein
LWCATSSSSRRRKRGRRSNSKSSENHNHVACSPLLCVSAPQNPPFLASLS